MVDGWIKLVDFHLDFRRLNELALRFCAVLILGIAISLQLGSLISNLPLEQDSTLVSYLAVVVDTILIAMTFVVLIVAGLLSAIWFQAAGYFGFFVFHCFNFGRKCYCLNQNYRSDIDAILATLLMAFALFLLATLIHPVSKIHLSRVIRLGLLFLFLAASLVQFSKNIGTVENLGIDLCRLIGRRLPILQLSLNGPQLPKDFECWVLNKDCDECKELAERLIPQSSMAFTSLPELKQLMIIDDGERYLIHLSLVGASPPKLQQVFIPVHLRIKDGVVAECSSDFDGLKIDR